MGNDCCSGSGYEPVGSNISGRKKNTTAIENTEDTITKDQNSIKEEQMKESGSDFNCPENYCIFARKHQGDENGQTTYRFGTLLFDETETDKILIKNVKQSDGQKQSSSKFECPDGTVMVGRKHDGDENGTTWFKYGELHLILNGTDEKKEDKIIVPLRTEKSEWTQGIKESSGIWGENVNPKYLMTGMEHSGDENGTTKYRFSEFFFNPSDIEIVSISFDIDHGKILHENPEELAQQTYKNDTGSEQTQTFKWSKELSNTSTFNYTGGFKLFASYEYTAGNPIVAQSKITIGAETSHSWSNTTTTTEKTTYSLEQPIKVEAGKTIQAQSVITRGSMDVPYVVTFKSKFNDETATLSGMWNGTSTTNIVTTVKEI